jgi:hypothetical protein
MHKMFAKAYMAGYLQKQADIADLLTAVSERGADAAKVGLLSAPVVGGALVGAGASALTSPSGDAKLLQKAMVVQELERAVADLERRKAMALIAERRKGYGKKVRSLHI